MAKITLSHLMDDHCDLIDVHITDLQGDLTVWEGDKPVEMPVYSNISFLFALEPLELKELGTAIEQILLQRRKDYPSLPQYDDDGPESCHPHISPDDTECQYPHGD